MTGLAPWRPLDRPLVARTVVVLAWSLWLLSDTVHPEIAWSRQVLRLAVDAGGWQWPAWALLPVTIVLLRGLRSWRRADPPRDASLGLAASAALLAGLRALSLWDLAGLPWPWLGLAWSPHASLALAGLALLGRRTPQGTAATPARGWLTWSPPRRAGALGASFALVFGAYTLYVCQMTMLHGDETQYLRVTQSLVRDGDLDLADDLDLEHALEYHVMQVGVHAAPGAPPGRLYSKHPAGLSVLLVPAYAAGLRAWSNPRLGAALFMAMAAAAAVALLCLWLEGLGFAPAIAILVTVLAATTAPLLLFSTQIYPEVPALLVLLIVLLRLPRDLVGAPPRTTSGPPASSHSHPLELAGLTALLGILPFLHPRYAPAAALLGLGVLWQAHRGPRRGTALVAVGVTAAGVAVLLVRHHLAFSGDWLGNFRPGAAWGEGAISPATWPVSLPGHWVHATKGLALNAPWYFVAAVAGTAVLVRRRDRRLLTAAGLYATTAVVNGVHPDWTFGFCLPARFLVTALPALALVAAAGLETCRMRGGALLLLSLGAALSWDTIWQALKLPELAFQAEHVARASLASYYPFTAHAVPQTATTMAAEDAAFWLASVAFVVILVLPRRPLSTAGLILLSVAPAVWGRSEVAAGRLRYAVPHSVRRLTDGRVGHVGTVVSVLRRLRDRTTGQRSTGGAYVADGADAAGLLAGFFLPVQQPGLYRLTAREVEARGRQTAILEHRRVLPATQPWARRRSVPIQAGQDGRFHLDGYLADTRLGYLDFAFDGRGHLRLGHVSLDFRPMALSPAAVEAARFSFDDRGRIPNVAVSQRLDPGRYLVRFEVQGNGLGTLTARQPLPVEIAVAVTSAGDSLDSGRLRSWFESDRRLRWVEAHPEALRPQREALIAPWRASLPLAGRSACELTFLVRRSGAVWFLYRYDGPAPLRLGRIVVDRLRLEPRPG